MSDSCPVCSAGPHDTCDPLCVRDMAKELTRELKGLGYETSYDHDTYVVTLEINRGYVRHLLFEPKEDLFYEFKIVTGGNPGRPFGTMEINLIPSVVPGLIERFISAR